MDSSVSSVACLRRFRKSFSRIAEIWKQTRCPAVGEDMKMVVHPDGGIQLNNEKKHMSQPGGPVRKPLAIQRQGAEFRFPALTYKGRLWWHVSVT